MRQLRRSASSAGPMATWHSAPRRRSSSPPSPGRRPQCLPRLQPSTRRAHASSQPPAPMPTTPSRPFASFRATMSRQARAHRIARCSPQPPWSQAHSWLGARRARRQCSNRWLRNPQRCPRRKGRTCSARVRAERVVEKMSSAHNRLLRSRTRWDPQQAPSQRRSSRSRRPSTKPRRRARMRQAASQALLASSGMTRCCCSWRPFTRPAACAHSHARARRSRRRARMASCGACSSRSTTQRLASRRATWAAGSTRTCLSSRRIRPSSHASTARWCSPPSTSGATRLRSSEYLSATRSTRGAARLTMSTPAWISSAGAPLPTTRCGARSGTRSSLTSSRSSWMRRTSTPRCRCWRAR
mmetsp:Transcript_15054/g.34530  ORF Transcript_15054/g.34530 Transcript_15054/m.34530 type:complete len:356 (+) Transcript_15054:636-1703(+)